MNPAILLALQAAIDLGALIAKEMGAGRMTLNEANSRLADMRKTQMEAVAKFQTAVAEAEAKAKSNAP
jgi:hypothetical protein